MGNPEKLNDDMMEKVAGGTLTQDQALAQALAYANLDRSQVDFVKRIELDYEHGRKVYEIKFYQGGFEYEFDVDAENGSILKYEKDFD
ncbi:MAG: PepSY domain-containing protein [Lachnospiraceae bacterium]|nr:PepSY domain-containing protein [Stomatobaculum sp.]MBP3736214.1 PepSY domain-containing protein [Lachnospiraceae bacterium]